MRRLAVLSLLITSASLARAQVRPPVETVVSAPSTTPGTNSCAAGPAGRVQQVSQGPNKGRSYCCPANGGTWTDCTAAGGGSGNMSTGDYDTDVDGIVDKAEVLGPANALATGKPLLGGGAGNPIVQDNEYLYDPATNTLTVVGKIFVRFSGDASACSNSSSLLCTRLISDLLTSGVPSGLEVRTGGKLEIISDFSDVTGALEIETTADNSGMNIYTLGENAQLTIAALGVNASVGISANNGGAVYITNGYFLGGADLGDVLFRPRTGSALPTTCTTVGEMFLLCAGGTCADASNRPNWWRNDLNTGSCNWTKTESSAAVGAQDAIQAAGSSGSMADSGMSVDPGRTTFYALGKIEQPDQSASPGMFGNVMAYADNHDLTNPMVPSKVPGRWGMTDCDNSSAQRVCLFQAGVMAWKPPVPIANADQAVLSTTLSGEYVTGSALLEVADEGTGLTRRKTINWIGSGVSCVDNSGSGRTDCTVSSGGGDIDQVGSCTTGSCFTSVAPNLFLASPDGSTAAITPRAIVMADLPTTNAGNSGRISSVLAEMRGAGTAYVDDTSTAETSLCDGTFSGTVTIPTAFWVQGRYLKVTASGTYLTGAGPPTLTIRIRSGGVSGDLLLQTTALTLQASFGSGSEGQWEAIGLIEVRTVGSPTGTTISFGKVTVEGASGALSARSFKGSSPDATVTTTMNATRDIVVTGQWASNATNTHQVKCQQMLIEAW